MASCLVPKLRHLLFLLKIVAALLGLVVVLLQGLLVIRSIDRNDGFALPNAALADAGFLERSITPEQVWQEDTHAVRAHRLAKSSGTVFGNRFYAPGNVFIIDDQSYRKLTVWIAQGVPSQPLSLALGQAGGAIAVYTSGGSSWPRHACAGIVHDGQVTIKPVRSRFGGTHWRVRVVGALRLREDGLGFDMSYCPKLLDEQFEAEALKFEELTPWLGLAGENSYQESHR